MSVLSPVVNAVADYDRFVDDQVQLARTDKKLRERLLARWRQLRENAGTVTTETGLSLPRVALPQTDDTGEIARYLFGEGAPGEFPFVNAAYREMYLEHGSGDAR